MWSALTTNGQSTCGNSDFEVGSFAGWNGSYGTCCPISITNQGIVTGRHTIMTGPGIDPYSLGKIPVVAPGGSYSARIGNDDSGAESDRLTYQFQVSSANTLFMYQYALVLEDPQHTAQHQPRFKVDMYDQFDDPIPCATYEVTAASNLPGFFDNGKVRLKEWSSVAIDLSAYIGQTVRIEFSVSDCGLGAHFGYAYLDCSCGALNITSEYCENSNTVILNAPAGFTYNWSNGSTSQSIIVQNPSQGMIYSVTLSSPNGCQVTLDHTLEPVLVNTSFSFNGCSSDISFADNSSTTNGTIVSWDWDFGDGIKSILKDPSHQYSSPGSYFVTLKVQSSLGCIDSLVKKIDVLEGPNAAFGDYTSCFYKPVAFIDSSSSDHGPITSWKWYFGDSSPTSSLQFPSHKYAIAANYRVSLLVADNTGCTDSTSKIIRVFDPPVASFTADDVCFGNATDFVNSSSTFNAMQMYYSWNMGDNNGSSSLQDPQYIYSNPGIYNVQLITTVDSYCSDTLSKDVVVAPMPVPDFQVNFPCVGQEAIFVDKTSLLFGHVQDWAWDFGNGGPGSNLQSPVYIYPNAGT
ncbi:MAG: PKD domain-containing protein, partial [Bacteroidia bacterium]|nr:PKD domain-containing protein [Bacteroidia bacterium]